MTPAVTTSGYILDLVEAEIARLTAIRDAIRGFTIPTPAAAPAPAEPPAREPADAEDGEQHVSILDRRLIVARAMLTNGPMPFTRVQRLLNKTAETTSKTLKCEWFRKRGTGHPGSAGWWELTPAGRSAAARGGTPGPVGDLRHNPDLDAAFDPEPPRGADRGKAPPRPFSTNGTGRHHANGTATAEPPAATEPTTTLVLRFLADHGPAGFARITGALPVHPATVGKAMNKLEARGLIHKRGVKAMRGDWEITDAGRAWLAGDAGPLR